MKMPDFKLFNSLQSPQDTQTLRSTQQATPISFLLISLHPNEYGLPDLADGQKHQTDDIGWYTCLENRLN